MLKKMQIVKYELINIMFLCHMSHIELLKLPFIYEERKFFYILQTITRRRNFETQEN